MLGFMIHNVEVRQTVILENAKPSKKHKITPLFGLRPAVASIHFRLPAILLATDFTTEKAHSQKKTATVQNSKKFGKITKYFICFSFYVLAKFHNI